MARIDMGGAESADFAKAQMGGEAYLELGMMYAAGRDVELDRIEAHKWLNIAALRGSREAVRLRAELSAEMTAAEIAAAQREARLWLSRH
jgi:TPR repeat protein